MQINLSIAGFSIQLISELDISLDIGFRHFIADSQRVVDVFVDCRKKDDTDFFKGAECVFKASDEKLKFYEIYRQGDQLLFAVFDQEDPSCIQQIALLDSGLKHWIIWSDEKNGALEPLFFPMAPILLHYAVLNADAVMMHASGVFDGEKGRLFSGFSGAGKSTISGIWRDAGSQLINDDRLIIRRENDRYYIYNTPMYYEDENKKAPLDAVFLIYHSTENVIQQVKGAAAVSGIMAFSIQNNYDQRFVQHHLEFFSKMAESIPIYKLGFVPDSEVIDFIKENGV